MIEIKNLESGEKRLNIGGTGMEIINDMRAIIAGVAETFEAGKKDNASYLAGLMAMQIALEKEKRKIDEEIRHLALMFAVKMDGEKRETKDDDPDPLDSEKVKEMEEALEKRMRKEDL